MRTTVRHDIVVSPNLAAANPSDVSVYPCSCRVGDEIVCVYRRGEAKHSRDGVLLAQSSADGGATWSTPVVVFDGMHGVTPESVHTGVVCQWNGVALAFFKTVEAKEPDAYIFSEEGRRLRQRAYMCRSDDGVRSWSEPVELELWGGPRDTFLGCRPLALPDGRLLIPVEATAEHGQQMMLGCFSDDGGRTLSSLFPIAHDAAGRLGFGDGKLALMPDGRIVMLAWTYHNPSEETIEVHRCVSEDGGRTWSWPEPTNIVCQVISPLSLGDGTLLAAGNVRTPPEGIRLLQSLDAGATWSDTPIQLWDARQLKVTGAPLPIAAAPGGDNVIWDALPSFTFGSPELTRLPDGDVLLTYYAIVNEVTHVRACRFAVDGV
jgi:hypothetical protein